MPESQPNFKSPVNTKNFKKLLNPTTFTIGITAGITALLLNQCNRKPDALDPRDQLTAEMTRLEQLLANKSTDEKLCTTYELSDTNTAEAKLNQDCVKQRAGKRNWLKNNGIITTPAVVTPTPEVSTSPLAKVYKTEDIPANLEDAQGILVVVKAEYRKIGTTPIRRAQLQKIANKLREDYPTLSKN